VVTWVGWVGSEIFTHPPSPLPSCHIGVLTYYLHITAVAEGG
jgi:hypothetical protein